MHCGLRLGLAGMVCGNCLREPPAFVKTCCAVDYGFPWDRVITAFKFEDRLDWAPALAKLLHCALPAAPEVDLVLPIPLSAQRLAERGYNQAWELTKVMQRRTGHAALADALVRLIDAPDQHLLPRAQRLNNLRGAFAANPEHVPRLVGARVLLVDDVRTTGATLNSAAQALRQAGAANIDALVLARTPSD